MLAKVRKRNCLISFLDVLAASSGNLDATVDLYKERVSSARR